MVDQFQAYLLLVLTALFVYLVVRVVRDDRERAKRGRKKMDRAVLAAAAPVTRGIGLHRECACSDGAPALRIPEVRLVDRNNGTVTGMCLKLSSDPPSSSSRCNISTRASAPPTLPFLKHQHAP